MPKKKNKVPKLPLRVIKYLEKAGIKHEIIKHKKAYTAFDTAQTMKRKLSEVVKTLLIKVDKDYYFVLLSADQNLDLPKLKKVLGKETKKEIKVLKIPNEKSIKESLKLKKEEAMAAFAGLYSRPVIIEKSLLKVKKAVFASESFNHSVELAVKDFIKLENAILASFGVKKRIKLTELKKPKRKKTVASKSKKKK